MGIFDKEANKRINVIEKRFDKIENANLLMITTINDLKNRIEESEKRSPDFEKEARQASKKASEFKNKANDTLNEITTLLSNASQQKEKVESLSKELSNSINDLKEEYENFTQSSDEIEVKKEEVFTKFESINAKINEIEEIFENYPDINVELTKLDDFIAKTSEIHSKSAQFLKDISSTKIEIDKLHKEIFGFEETVEDESTRVNGLKDDLDDAYNGLDEKLNDLSESIAALEQTSNANYQTFYEKSKESNANLLTSWEQKYAALNSQIQSLLPRALTAGLSSAFSSKKDEELKSYEKHKKQFGLGIGGMIAVSLIPFSISVYFIITGVNLDVVIGRAPRLALAILPLYIPVLWLSISSSKKMNLSKRLIEEYSHKEVLSKTFEGLSGQIEGIKEREKSEELKTVLLENFLHMYSENPGKLISDYNTSDHPIMELLENANKLEGSIEKLRRIPGMKKISNYLEEKAKDKLEQVTEKIDKAIDKAIDNEEVN